jgi:undecaprenyl-diphosphatase
VIEILILSVVQGITEFLPISSSSHLILFSKFLNFKSQSLSIDVSLHIGSFLAVVIYFYKDLLNFLKNKILFFKIVISSIPVMILGFFLVKFGLIEKIRNIETIAWTTIIFGILLYISDKFKLDKNIEKNFSYKSAILIGFFQILSLIPGVSRSGIGITAARLLNFNRTDSAKISFLISIPILAAVSIFGITNLIISEDFIITKLNLVSIFLSFLFSFATIKYFLIYIKKFSLNIFVYYRVLLGFILLLLVYL